MGKSIARVLEKANRNRGKVTSSPVTLRSVAQELPVRREEIFSEGPVKFSVPADAVEVNSKHVGRPYLKCNSNIQVYVYGVDLSFRGRKVVGNVKIMKAVYADGRERFYCDLEVADETSAADFELKIHTDPKQVPGVDRVLFTQEAGRYVIALQSPKPAKGTVKVET